MKLKVTLVAIALGIVGLSIWADRSSTQEAPQKNTTIGAILPLSGDFAQFGEAINQGITLALDEARAEGIHIDYVLEDDNSQTVGSVNAAKKLINVDAVDAVLTATVQEAKPIAPLINEAGIPLIVVWDSTEFIKTAGPRKELERIWRSMHSALGVYKMSQSSPKKMNGRSSLDRHLQK